MSRKAYIGKGPKGLAADARSNPASAVQALRTFRGGFDAADGYDLRNYSAWPSQKKSAVTRALASLGEHLATPDLRILDKQRYGRTNNAKIKRGLSKGQNRKYKVHFINDPTHGTRPISFKGTAAVIAGAGQPQTLTGQVDSPGALKQLAGDARKLAGRGNPVFLTWTMWGTDFNLLPGYRIDKWKDIPPVVKSFRAALIPLAAHYKAEIAAGGLYAAMTWE